VRVSLLLGSLLKGFQYWDAAAARVQVQVAVSNLRSDAGHSQRGTRHLPCAGGVVPSASCFLWGPALWQTLLARRPSSTAQRLESSRDQSQNADLACVTPAGAEQGPCHRPGAGRAVRDRAAVRVHLLAPRPVRPLRRLHPGGQGAGVLREFYIHLLVCGSMASAFLVAILRCWRPHSHFWRMVEDGCRRRRLCTNNLHRLCWVAR